MRKTNWLALSKLAWFPVAFFFSLLFSLNMSAQRNPLDAAKGFAVFTESNLTLINTTIEGAVAVGDDFRFQNAVITNSAVGGYTAPGESGKYTGLWVEGTILPGSIGQLDMKNNTVVRLADPANWRCNTSGLNSRLNLNGGFDAYPRINMAGTEASCSQVTAMGNLSVKAAFNGFRQLGNCIENSPANAAVSAVTYNTSTISVGNTDGVYYCDMSVANLLSFKTFTATGASQNRPLIIRVNGGGQDYTINSSFRFDAAESRYVFFYFYNMPALTINNMGGDFQASILAPNTNLAKNNNQAIKGQIIAQSLLMTGSSAGEKLFEGQTNFMATIGDYVWNDQNANGVQDSTEKGLSDIIVSLYNSADNTMGNTDDGLVMQARTAANGRYTFTNVPALSCGSVYYLRFTNLSPGNKFTSPLSGSNNDVNSKVALQDATNGRTAFFAVTPGLDKHNMDAGIIVPDINTLPLHTLYLTARLQGERVQLVWIAENEFNTSHFSLQRTTDGVHYAEVTTKQAEGPVNIPREYFYSDSLRNGLISGTVMYRVKAMDNSGRYDYSNIATVKITSESDLELWPVPFSDAVNISYKASSVSQVNVSVMSVTGQLLRQYTTRVGQGINYFQVTGLNQLSAGTYYIQLRNTGTGQITVRKVVKQ